MKITKRQLRRVINEVKRQSGPGPEWFLQRQAGKIFRHYDTIASDVGEIYVDDLIDHWYGEHKIPPKPGVRDEIIRLNYGNEYIGGDDY